MVTLKVEGKKYKVPIDFDELNIKTYQELCRVETKNEKIQIVEYINILTGLYKKTIGKLELDDIRMVTQLFNFFRIKLEDHPLIHAVKIKNKIYVLDQNLFNMTFDMFVDLEEMTKEKDLIIDNLHLIIAILYRPAIKKKMFSKKLTPEVYDSDSVKDRAEFFSENMMMDKILGALFFFINLRTKYMENMAVYLDQQKVEIEKKTMSM